jgi:hypothetical protein
MSSPRGNMYAEEALVESEGLFKKCAAVEEEEFGLNGLPTRSSKRWV